ncbi:MAG: hypothetical protein EXR62_04635 [Chloroflexi bacterium]|nr:hypothetical protein [Chloroflexota bacterium]
MPQISMCHAATSRGSHLTKEHAMARRVPDQYITKVKKPNDFDAFWQGVLEQAAKIPLDPQVTLDPLRSSEDVDVYNVYYTSLDQVRIFAWYCVPKQRQGRLPAILTMPGYISDPPISKEWARLGYAALTPAPRGKIRSNRQVNPGYPNLLTHNIVDRHTYVYRGFFVDAWRTVDFLLGREEIDPQRIGVTGGSQGGGLTITTAAMRPEIKAAVAGAPYLTGFIDAIALERTYPYDEINDYLRLYPQQRPQVEETLAYFDGINFADKIRCPTMVYIGLQDNVCPPETGYAVFNAIGSRDKQLYAYDGHGHDSGRYQHNTLVEQFFHTHLKA